MIPMTPYTVDRALRLGLAMVGEDYPRQPRKRVLMKRMRIGGTIYNPGTIINSVSVRSFFTDRHKVQDHRLNQYLEKENG